MRLTKNMRRALVRAVMADVPFVDYHEHQTKLLTEWAVSIMPHQCGRCGTTRAVAQRYRR